MNGKRSFRLHKEMALRLRLKPPKRCEKATLKVSRCAATAPNEIWSMDCVHHQLATGPKLVILTIVDTFSRYSPATVPQFRAPDVADLLERVCAEIGYRGSIRVDHDSEFVSRELDLWAYVKDVTPDFSRPGKPTDSAFIESFNGKFRAECLNAHWFLSLAGATTNPGPGVETTTKNGRTAVIGDKPPITLMIRLEANDQPVPAGAG